MNIVGASGSAILVTGSSVAKFEIQFPSWSVNDQKNYYPYSVATNLQSSYYPPKYGKFSYSTGSMYYEGFINAPNGYLYGMPARGNTSIIKISTTGSSPTFSYITTSSLGVNFGGAALASNNCIYMFLRGYRDNGENRIFKINTVTDQISTIGSLPAGNLEDSFVGAILAPNGYIYGLPTSYGAIVKVNPNNDTLSTVGPYIPGGSFNNGVLAPNGCIYCAPSYYTSIYKIDTNTDTISTISTGLSVQNDKYAGGVLAPNNGCIYFIPNNNTSAGILKIDTKTDQVSFIATSAALSQKGGVLGPDGLIYCSSDTTTKLIINPFNDTVSSTFGYPSYRSIMGFDGAFYSNGLFAGYVAGGYTLIVAKDNRTYDLDPNYVLSRYRNYF